jgi:hypothetical protein
MLHEIVSTRQHPGELLRRWFQDDSMDLFVWTDDAGEVTRFQLAYDKPHAEKAISWKQESGFVHTGVDDGSRPGHHPGAPLLVADGEFAALPVLNEFKLRAKEMDPSIVAVVVRLLGAYPERIQRINRTSAD